MQPSALRRSRRWTIVLATLLGLLSLNLVPATASALSEFEGISTPTISGSGVVGTDFTATIDLSQTTPTPESVTFLWFRADTHVFLHQSSSPTFTAPSSLIGVNVYVVAYLHAPGVETGYTQDSHPSVTVRDNGFTWVHVPTISGSGLIGTDFTASLNLTDTSPAPSSVTFSWFDAESGALLQSGLSDTLTATPELEGKNVYVVATLSAPDTQDYMTLNSPFSNTVRKGEFSGVNTPVVSGSGVIGTDFTASLDFTGTSPSPDTVTYTWYRVDTGAELQTGTGTTLTATRALEGTGVYVIATLMSPSAGDYVTLNSPFSNTVHEGGFSGVNTPVVSGSGVIGTDFTASLELTGTTPAPASVTYTWYRADTNAELQTGTTLTATRALEGTGVYVIATLTAPDTVDYVTVNSPFSNRVRKGGFSGVNTPVVSGSGVIGTDFTASLDLTGTTPAPAPVTYTWYRADTNAELQTGTGTTLTATRALEGTGVYVIATLTAPDTIDYVTRNSPFSSTVRKGEFTQGDAPTIGGQHALFGTLTADIDTATWTPTPTSVSWEWFLSDGTPISGANQASLAMTADLVGKSVYAVATLHADDITDYVIATAPSGKIAAPTLSLPAGVKIKPGSTVPFKAWGLLFNTDYTFELHSDPIALGTRTASAVGTLDTSFTIPANAPSGSHRLVVLLGGQEVGSLDIEIAGDPVKPVKPVKPSKPGQADSPATPALAHTGASAAMLPGLGFAALLLVGGILMVSRSRRSAGTGTNTGSQG